MTFSQQVKNELAKVKAHCGSCKVSTLYGMLMASRGIREDSVTLNIENKATVDFFANETAENVGVIVTVQSPDLLNGKSRPYYTATIDSRSDIDSLIAQFFGDISQKHIINKDRLKSDCCRAAFLRGIFLICGSIINPQREYHLELSLSSERLADQVTELFGISGFEFKKTYRQNNIVLYIKESEQIEDVLTYLGAVVSSLELMNMKIEKELRNNVNRVTNCETANISKTVNASLSQIEKIKKIKDEIGLDELPLELQDVALLRLLNPDASLNELCRLFNNTISRSGLNHRLKRLMEIADELGRE